MMKWHLQSKDTLFRQFGYFGWTDRDSGMV